MLVRMKYLHRNRHGTFQLRLVVPKELRGKAGKAERFWTLGTRVEAEAVRRLPKKQAEADAYLAALRSETVLSPIEAERMSQRWLLVSLAKDEEARRAQDFPSHAEGQKPPAVVGLDVLADALLERARDGDFSGVDVEVDEILDAEGLALAPGSESRKRLAQAVLADKVRLLRIQHERSMGRWVPVEAAAAAKLAPKTPTLREAHKAWVAQKPRSATALSDWRQAVERFVSLHGDLPIGEIERRQVAAFRDDLLTEKGTNRAPATVEKLVAAIRSILQKQVDDGVLQSNPATGVKVAKRKNAPKAREDFTIEELQKIFSATVFTEGVRPERAGGEASYWVFVLGLYTGARLGELCQLDVADVTQEWGTWVASIHDFDETKTLKTSNSRRVVPLHSAVIALGFDRYVASLDAKGRLFPDLKPIGRRAPSQRFSRWANELIDDVGVINKKLTFHSLRHTFITACRRAEIGEDIYQRLTGHTNGNVGRAYGKAEVQTLARAVNRLEYGSLKIPEWRPGRLIGRHRRPRR